jgi:hypothetical protein
LEPDDVEQGEPEDDDEETTKGAAEDAESA